MCHTLRRWKRKTIESNFCVLKSSEFMRSGSFLFKKKFFALFSNSTRCGGFKRLCLVVLSSPCEDLNSWSVFDSVTGKNTTCVFHGWCVFWFNSSIILWCYSERVERHLCLKFTHISGRSVHFKELLLCLRIHTHPEHTSGSIFLCRTLELLLPLHVSSWQEDRTYSATLSS